MYRLEIENFGEWDLIDSFESVDEASRHGQSHFADNVWRVVDRNMTRDGAFAFEAYYSPFDSSGSIVTEGRQQIQHFENVRQFVAVQDRRRQVRESNQRRARIQSGRGRNGVWNRADQRFPFEDDEAGWFHREKTNWMKEGF